MSTPAHVLVFVYGSLKRFARNHEQMRGALFLREVRVPGATLVLYEDAYPALVRTADARHVQGELYAVTAEHLLRLDAFEDCPWLYQREELLLDDGARAFSYVIQPQQALGYQEIGACWLDGAAKSTF